MKNGCKSYIEIFDPASGEISRVFFEQKSNNSTINDQTFVQVKRRKMEDLLSKHQLKMFELEKIVLALDFLSQCVADQAWVNI